MGLALSGLFAVGGALAQAPTVQVIFPETGKDVEGVVNLRAYADKAGNVNSIDSVVFFRQSAPGTRISLTRVAAEGEWSGTWNVSSLNNGAETVVFRAYENSSPPESTSVSINVTIANGTGGTQPSISVTAPVAGSTVQGNTTINYTAAPGTGAIDRTYIRIDGGTAVSISGGTYNFGSGSLASGSHTVQLTVVNTNGDSASTPVITYQIDNQPLVTLTSPAGGDTVGGNLTVNYSSTPRTPATIATDSLYLDGKGFSQLTAGQANIVDISALADGNRAVRIKTTDSQGRIAWSSSVNVQVNNSPSASVDRALADSLVSGTLVVPFTVDAVSPATVSAVHIALDGGSYRATSTDSSDTLDTRPLSDGPHSIVVRVTDNRGRTAFSQVLQFRVDNRPRVSLLDPVVDSLVNGDIEIVFEAQAVSPDSIVKREISLGGGAWITTSSVNGHVFSTRNFRDGDLRVQVRSQDASGKIGYSSIREITVDNSPPKISLPTVGYPDQGDRARTGTQMRISAQALDFIAGMDPDSALVFSSDSLSQAPLRILLLDNGESGDEVKGDNIFSSWVTVENSTTGKIAFSLRGRDALGNDTTLTGFINLDNVAPNLSMAVEPLPEGGNALEGEVYTPRIRLKGTFSDSGGSGLREVKITVHNDSGNPVNDSPIAVPLDAGEFSRLVYLVPGLNTIRLISSDWAGNSSTMEARITYVLPRETRLIGLSGGQVAMANGSGVTIPSDALYKPTEITARRMDPSEQPKPLDGGVRLLGVPHDFGPDGTVFRRPVTVTLAYTEADLDTNQDGRADFNENELTMVFWNGSSWVSAGDVTRDTGANRISVQSNHFTIYDLAATTNTASNKLVAYWNANPIVERSEFIYRAPESGKVSLHILDMAGDLVRELIPSNTRVELGGTVQWDGSNVSGRFAGAGLYIYVFRYESANGKVKELIRKPIGLARQ